MLDSWVVHAYFCRWTCVKDMCVAAIADCGFNMPVPRWLSGRTGRVRSWKPGRSGWRRGYAGEKCSTPSSSRPSALFVFLFRRHFPFHHLAADNQWIISNRGVCLFNWLCFIKLSLCHFCESVSLLMAEISAHITYLHTELISYERVWKWGVPPR